MTEPENNNGDTHWQDSLPEDIRNNDTFAQFKSLDTFARSHLELRNMDGNRGDYVT